MKNLITLGLLFFFVFYPWSLIKGAEVDIGIDYGPGAFINQAMEEFAELLSPDIKRKWYDIFFRWFHALSPEEQSLWMRGYKNLKTDPEKETFKQLTISFRGTVTIARRELIQSLDNPVLLDGFDDITTTYDDLRFNLKRKRDQGLTRKQLIQFFHDNRVRRRAARAVVAQRLQEQKALEALRATVARLTAKEQMLKKLIETFEVETGDLVTNLQKELPGNANAAARIKRLEEIFTGIRNKAIEVQNLDDHLILQGMKNYLGSLGLKIKGGREVKLVETVKKVGKSKGRGGIIGTCLIIGSSLLGQPILQYICKPESLEIEDLMMDF